MKHIKVIIKELQTSGKYMPIQKMTKTNKKLSILQSESLLFSVITSLSEDYESAVAVSHLLGVTLEMIQGETDGLVTLRDSASIINALIDFMIEDSTTASEITKMYIQAFESNDLKSTVESYLYYKEKYITEGEI